MWTCICIYLYLYICVLKHYCWENAAKGSDDPSLTSVAWCGYHRGGLWSSTVGTGPLSDGHLCSVWRHTVISCQRNVHTIFYIHFQFCIFAEIVGWHNFQRVRIIKAIIEPSQKTDFSPCAAGGTTAERQTQPLPREVSCLYGQICLEEQEEEPPAGQQSQQHARPADPSAPRPCSTRVPSRNSHCPLFLHRLFTEFFSTKSCYVSSEDVGFFGVFFFIFTNNAHNDSTNLAKLQKFITASTRF